MSATATATMAWALAAGGRGALAASGAWLAAGAVHWILFAVIALGRSEPDPVAEPAPDVPFLVLIPGHRSGMELAEAVRSVRLQTDYPQELVEIVVVADHCEPSVALACEAAGARVLRLVLECSTKVASLNRALAEEVTGGRGDDPVVLILDADNLIAPGFLRQFASVFARGAVAAQARRVARNWDSPTARADMASEALNNAVFRRARRRLGLPASLIGSGMGFRLGLLRRHLGEMDSVGGFDKDLEGRLLGEGHDVEYLEQALCLDEKLADAAAFARQKRRWLSTQPVYLSRHAAAFGRALVALPGGKGLGMVDKWLQWAFPPRPILAAGLLVHFLSALLAGSRGWALASLSGLILLVSLHVAVLAREGLLRLLPELAATAVRLTGCMGRAALRMRGANRSFILTPHGPPATIGEVAMSARAASVLPRGVREALAGVPVAHRREGLA